MRIFFADLLANVYVWFGAIAVWKEDLDYWLKIAVGASALIVSAVTVYYKIKKNGGDK